MTEHRWLQTAQDQRAFDSLRARFQEDATRILIFLGAGLSFGVGRFLGRATFDHVVPWDQDRFPTWPMLIERMKTALISKAKDEEETRSLDSFFENNDPLDATQLFKASLTEGEYERFLRRQFGSTPTDVSLLTPSHIELVRLGVPELFTTNYDELLELAFESQGVHLVTSDGAEDFLQHRVEAPPRHLLKLHGTIRRPAGIVLTRDDYAVARRDRVEMFTYLAQQLRFTTFLFLGFSLADPNFNLLRDEARLAMQDNMPT